MAPCMGDEQEAEENLKLMKMNFFKKQYPELRKNFLESFKVLYCSSMNDPYLNKLFKTQCNQKHTEINYKHHEMVMYINNIIAWLDPKMDYCDDDSTTRSIPRFKTSFIHDEEHVSRVCLHNIGTTEPRSSKLQSICDSGASENILDSTGVNEPSDMKKFQKKSNSIARKRKQNNIYDVGVTSESIPNSTEVNELSDTKKLKKKSNSISRKRKQNNINDVGVTSENIFDSTEVDEPSDTKKLKKKSNSISISRKIKQNNINDGVTSENILDSTEVNEPSDMKKFQKKSNSISRKTKQNNINDSNSDKISNDSPKKSIENMYRKNNKGETNLHKACRKGKLDVVTNLLSYGFNPNIKDNAGWTPLHEAVKSGHKQIVQQLIDYGAYLNVPGFEYDTPLHIAIYYYKFDIALLLYHNGADVTFMNMYGVNVKSFNEEIWTKLIKSEIPYVPSRTKYVYESDQITITMYKVSLTTDAVKQFCEQFNIKLVQNILRLKESELKQVTHIILPKTENNICDVNMETLTGIANGLFLVNERWVFDSLEQNILLSCENYEVSGTKNYVDYNGPKISRINKEKLNPKLFDGLSIHLNGSVGWESFSLEQLQELIVKFGAKFLYRMPSPENCIDNIFPYHFRTNMEMCNVSTIVLYMIDSNRLIKYNMKHLKAFPVSWFMEAIQKYTIPKMSV